MKKILIVTLLISLDLLPAAETPTQTAKCALKTVVMQGCSKEMPDIVPALQTLKTEGVDFKIPFEWEGKELSALNHLLARSGTAQALRSFLICKILPPPNRLGQLLNSCIVDNNEEDIEKLLLCLSYDNRRIYYASNATFLVRAIDKGNIALAAKIISRCPHYCIPKIAKHDHQGRHALHHLVDKCTYEEDLPHAHACIDLLAPYVNIVDRNGTTPLMLAKKPAIAAHLLALGADPFMRNTDGATALTKNIYFPNATMAGFLISQYPEAYDESKKGALIQCAFQVRAIYQNAFLDYDEHTSQAAVECALKALHYLNEMKKILRMLATSLKQERSLARTLIASHLPHNNTNISSGLRQREEMTRPAKRSRHG